MANRLNPLVHTVNALKVKYGRVDAILYHQGERDATLLTPGSEYENTLRKMQAAVNVTFLVAIATKCCSDQSVQIATAQANLGRNTTHFLPGPNSDSLNNSYRSDCCHFNHIGLQRLAELWVDKLQPIIYN